MHTHDLPTILKMIDAYLTEFANDRHGVRLQLNSRIQESKNKYYFKVF